MPAVRRVVLALAFVLGVATASPHAQNRTFDLLTAGIADIQAAVDAGALTYERLVQMYLDRIEAYDKHGPRLRAIIEINARSLAIARDLDRERRETGRRGPLHGIPIAVKDNIDVTDIPSTGGAIAFAGTYPARDATVVRRLREAGAIIFVKTNMDELALGTRGLSSLGGQILNPYDLTRHPGGSSGGTAVAVNVAFATVGLATETGFSTRGPASNNAIVGIAPTRGLVSRAGVIPISFTQDRVGVHARSVADAALLLDRIRGFDPDDLTTVHAMAVTSASSTLVATDALRGSRIGILRDLFRKGPEFEAGNTQIDSRLAVLRSGGATLVDNLSSGADLLSLMPILRVNNYELHTAFEAYLRRRGPASPIKSSVELVASGTLLKVGMLETRFKDSIKAGDLATNAEYLARLAEQQRIRQLLVDLMERHHLDALVYPVKSLAAPPIGTADDGPRDNNISAVTGLPAVVVPAGFHPDGLPLALEILGRPFTEARLIELARGYEQASPRRIAPHTTPGLRGEVFAF